MWRFKFYIVTQIFLLLSITIEGSSGQCEYDDKCGSFNETDYRRIVGGNDVGRFKYPWMALLYTDSGQGIEPFCGGVLVSNMHVITAGHCVAYTNWLDLGVLVGAYDWCDTNEPDQNHFRMKYITLHPDFANDTYNGTDIYMNDLAIIELDGIAPFENICLPCEAIFDGEPLVAIGWGTTDPQVGDMSCKQMWTTYRVVDSAECNGIGLICADSDRAANCYGVDDIRRRPEVNTKGDSGGPGLIMNKYRNYVLSGVIRGGPVNCDYREDSNSFVNIKEYMPWIIYVLTH